MRRITEQDEQRFWAKVSLPDVDGHMWWLGATGKPPHDYGSFYALGMTWRAHRMALYLAEGEPPGQKSWKCRFYEAAHAPVICHEPQCVAPAHLRWATPTENNHDAFLDGTMKRRVHRRRVKTMIPDPAYLPTTWI